MKETINFLQISKNNALLEADNNLSKALKEKEYTISSFIEILNPAFIDSPSTYIEKKISNSK